MFARCVHDGIKLLLPESDLHYFISGVSENLGVQLDMEKWKVIQPVKNDLINIDLN